MGIQVVIDNPGVGEFVCVDTAAGATGDPGAGNWQVTAAGDRLDISNLDGTGALNTGLWGQLVDGSRVYIRSAGKHRIYTVVSTVAQTGYREVVVDPAQTQESAGYALVAGTTHSIATYNPSADGTPGPEGPQGPVGPQGNTGAAGSQGIQGVAGNDGAAGIQGIQGIQGVPGNDGAAGADGADGFTRIDALTANSGSLAQLNAGITGADVADALHTHTTLPTPDQKDALTAAPTAPNTGNPFVTLADVGALGGGTVTSVSITATDGLEVDSGSPVTTAGTIVIGSDKLLGIEAGATADQTGAEIKTAYEGEANAYTDAKDAKLTGIEALADVTDATNVAAAGAPIISSGAGAPASTPTAVGNIYVDTTADTVWAAAGTASSADWKQATGAGGGDLLAANNLSDVASAVTARTNLGLAIGTNVQAWAAVLDATTASFLAADEAKLDAIEALADVTDATNVAAAGAPIISSGAGAPASTPSAVGDLYVDTTGDTVWAAAGTASSADWKQATGAGGGDLLAANNLSDVASAVTARSNLGLAIGTNVQAWSAVLDATTASFLAADETKLDGIETAATADQTGAEIKTAYEGEANAYTDTKDTKLTGIEALADVTDTANVTAAGAIMDSDVAEAEGFVRKTGAGAYEAIKTNLGATLDPVGAIHDVTLGYVVGSRWINVTLDKEFVCLDNTDGAAVWAQTNAAGGGEANLAANVGTGADVWRDKTGVTLNLRGINAASAKLTAAVNVDNIDIDLGSVALSDLSDGTAQQAAITANTNKVTNATHTGDVQGSGALTIQPSVVTDAMHAAMSGFTVKARATTGAGSPGSVALADDGVLGRVGAGNIVSLTPAQRAAQLPLATISVKGLAPVLSNVATEYLDGTGAYSTPALPKLSKSITIIDPVTAEDITFFHTPVAITITEINAVIRGTTPSVLWFIKHATMTTGRDSAGTSVITAGTTTTDQGGVNITSFDDATIPADSFLWIETTTVSGTNDELSLSLVYTED